MWCLDGWVAGGDWDCVISGAARELIAGVADGWWSRWYFGWFCGWVRRSRVVDCFCMKVSILVAMCIGIGRGRCHDGEDAEG